MPTSTQPCDPIRKLHVFTVEGKGTFPIDMLRYDSCWPKRELGSSDIHATFSRGAVDVRRIVMIGTSEPTAGRWESYGWRVL